MMQKATFVIGFLLLFGTVGGLECNTMTLGQAMLLLLIVGPMTVWSFVHSEWYELSEKEKALADVGTSNERK